MSVDIEAVYGNKLRVRACGIHVQDDRLLLVNHTLHAGTFWAPPGGGMSFGMSAAETVTREFLEETGLRVTVGKMLFVCEYIEKPLHALELFFRISAAEGNIKVGSDPEVNEQIIKDVRFLSMEEIRSLAPAEKHGIFRLTSKPAEMLTLRGYLKI